MYDKAISKQYNNIDSFVCRLDWDGGLNLKSKKMIVKGTLWNQLGNVDYNCNVYVIHDNWCKTLTFLEWLGSEWTEIY